MVIRISHAASAFLALGAALGVVTWPATTTALDTMIAKVSLCVAVNQKNAYAIPFHVKFTPIYQSNQMFTSSCIDSSFQPGEVTVAVGDLSRPTCVPAGQVGTTQNGICAVNPSQWNVTYSTDDLKIASPNAALTPANLSGVLRVSLTAAMFKDAVTVDKQMPSGHGSHITTCSNISDPGCLKNTTIKSLQWGDTAYVIVNVE